MFHHVKELQFNARVSKPDPRFARLLLQQFGGPNGELKAAMQYFIQAFPCRKAYPDKYDLLMDIATEKFSHLEIVGATIQMLLNGVNGKLKEEADSSELMQILDKKGLQDDLVHDALLHPHFYVESGGGPMLTDAMGVPFSGSFINANSDLSVDLRSNMAAETRAKIVYEYLMQFTDDPYVKESLSFLMTREIAHFQMFEAALATVAPNFPPGVLQGDPRFSNTYFNMSEGEDVRGPWNEGLSTKLAEEFRYVEDPVQHVRETTGLQEEIIAGTTRTAESVQALEKEVAALKGAEIRSASPGGHHAVERLRRHGAGLIKETTLKHTMKTIKWIPAALLLCLTAACNKDDDNNNSETLSTQDRSFMTNASYGNHAEISAGNLASAQGSMSVVKSFGSMMVSDHTAAQADLVAIGTQVGKTDLPTGPDSAHQAMAHMLMMMSGRAFDSAYMKMQVMDHQKTIDLMNTQISSGSNQRVKDYASSKLPTVQMHKRMADSIVSANGF